jgi:hypothetical protein
MEGAMARFKVELGAAGSGYPKVSYSESQAITFQKYARARLLGEDPTAAVIGADFLGAGRDPTRLEKILLPVIRGMEAIYDFAERAYNLIQGNGFQSVKSIYERARSGALAKTLDEEIVLDPARDAQMQTWKQYSAIHEKMSGRIAAIESQITDIQQRAAKEGC